MPEGSGSRWASLAREFVDRSTIQWGALATLLVWSFYTEVVLGIVEFVGSWVGVNVELLGALGDGLAELINRVVLIPVSAAYTAWASAASALFGGWLGPAAPLVAVAIVLAVVYIYGEATINRVLEWVMP